MMLNESDNFVIKMVSNGIILQKKILQDIVDGKEIVSEEVMVFPIKFSLEEKLEEYNALIEVFKEIAYEMMGYSKHDKYKLKMEVIEENE